MKNEFILTFNYKKKEPISCGEGMAQLRNRKVADDTPSTQETQRPGA